MKNTHLFEVILVFAIVLLGYGYFFSTTDWNTNSRLSLVKAVVEEKRFEIDTYHDAKGLLTMDKALVNGHFYSDKAIGSSLIGIAFYRPIRFIYYLAGDTPRIRIFKELITFLAIGLISAFLAPFMYSLTKKISKNSILAFIVTLAICLGTPYYKYSTAYYGHSLAGLFLFVAFFIWFNIKDEEKINALKIMISSYFLAFAIITEYPVAIIALGIGCYILYVLWKKQCLFDLKIYAYLIIGGILPIFIAMAYNYALFGHPLQTGYSHEVVETFVEGQSVGLMGIGLPNLHTLFYMTFHTTMGIFWQSPVLLLAFVGWFRMWKDSRYRVEAILSFSLILIYFLVMSGYYMWWGGAAFTPRSLIPIFPLFGIPLVFLTKKTEKVTLLIFSIVSIFQIFIVVAASSEGLIAIADNMTATSIRLMFQQPSMIYNVYFSNFVNQILETNRGREFFNLSGFSSLIPLLLIEASLLAAFIKITWQKSMHPTSLKEESS